MHGNSPSINSSKQRNNQRCIESQWSPSTSGRYSDWQKIVDETRIIIHLSKLLQLSHALWKSSHLTFFTQLNVTRGWFSYVWMSWGCAVACTYSLIVFVDSSVRRGCSDFDWHGTNPSRDQHAFPRFLSYRTWSSTIQPQTAGARLWQCVSRFLCSGANKEKKFGYVQLQVCMSLFPTSTGIHLQYFDEYKVQTSYFHSDITKTIEVPLFVCKQRMRV